MKTKIKKLGIKVAEKTRGEDTLDGFLMAAREEVKGTSNMTVVELVIDGINSYEVLGLLEDPRAVY